MTRKIYWDRWWPVVKALGTFPLWLRCVDTEGSISLEKPNGVNDEAVALWLGKDWVTLAYEGDDSGMLWGYFDDHSDMENMALTATANLSVSPTPDFLKGLED